MLLFGTQFSDDFCVLYVLRSEVRNICVSILDVQNVNFPCALEIGMRWAASLLDVFGARLY